MNPIGGAHSGGTPGAETPATIEHALHLSVSAFAAYLAHEREAVAVLFYGSNLRTGSLDGVLDFYVLLPGRPERGIWPRVSFREWKHNGRILRAKVATMSLAMFERAAAGETIDTTIWTRFVQPAALAWHAGAEEKRRTLAAIGQAERVAARLAVAVGPAVGREDAYWRALFRATYQAEFRVEKPGREEAILTASAAHFHGLLPAALAADGIECEAHAELLRPLMPASRRRRILAWWTLRRRLGRPLNALRLIRAAGTFEGAARYGAWKIERHTGHVVKLTPWRERHPVLAAPGVLWRLWRAGRTG